MDENKKKDKLKKVTSKQIRTNLVGQETKAQITKTSAHFGVSRNAIYKKIEKGGYEVFNDIRKKKLK